MRNDPRIYKTLDDHIPSFKDITDDALGWVITRLQREFVDKLVGIYLCPVELFESRKGELIQLHSSLMSIKDEFKERVSKDDSE